MAFGNVETESFIALQRAIDLGYVCSVCLSIFCEVRPVYQRKACLFSFLSGLVSCSCAYS